MDIAALDLNLLRILDALFEERSVSAVARRMKMSQPAVSAGLARLRAYFQDELFVRTGAGMRPTPFADELARPVAIVLGTIRDEILKIPVFEPGVSRRAFSLCMPDMAQLIFLPRLEAAVRRAAPHVALRCADVAPALLEDEMEEGRIDLAVGFFPELTGANVLCQRLFEHPFVCLVRDGFPGLGTRLELDQYLSADHLVVNQDGRGQAVYEHLIREVSLSGRTVLRLSSYLGVARIVAENDLVCTAPLAVGRNLAGAGTGVRLLPPPLAMPPLPLKQFWHRRLQSDPGLNWLKSIVVREFLNQDPYQDAAPARVAETA